MQVNYGERVALVGPNGAGKSTLFSVILKQNEPDEGVAETDEWITFGYLPQEAEALGDETVLDLATGRAGVVPELEETMRRLEEAGETDGLEYHEATSKLETLNDPKQEAKAKRMLHGLGYKEADFTRKAGEMSGGLGHACASRSASRHGARLAASRRTDEPPRPSSLLWLQNYLKSYSGGVLLISHDRQFMDEIIETVYEIADRSLFNTRATTPTISCSARQATSVRSPRTRTSRKKSRDYRISRTVFARVASKASQAQSKLKQIERMTKDREAHAAEEAVSFSNSPTAAHWPARDLARGHPYGLW